jgi:hypothetical protein
MSKLTRQLMMSHGVVYLAALVAALSGIAGLIGAPLRAG